MVHDAPRPSRERVRDAPRPSGEKVRDAPRQEAPAEELAGGSVTDRADHAAREAVDR
jgi:hypothetical protein